jgi:hypothetical protein
MPDPHDPDPDVIPLNSGDPLARDLQALQPVPARLDRDALLYAAGQASRGRSLSAWRACAAVQALVLCVGGTYLALADREPASVPAPNSATAPVPPAAPKPPPAPDSSEDLPIYAAENEGSELYRGLRRRADVIAAGVTALPSPVPPPPVADAAELERGLSLPPGVLAVPAAPKRPDPAPSVPNGS